MSSQNSINNVRSINVLVQDDVKALLLQCRAQKTCAQLYNREDPDTVMNSTITEYYNDFSKIDLLTIWWDLLWSKKPEPVGSKRCCQQKQKQG